MQSSAFDASCNTLGDAKFGSSVNHSDYASAENLFDVYLRKLQRSIITVLVSTTEYEYCLLRQNSHNYL